MSGFFCKWWDCPLAQVSEHQQESCERNGMDCQKCMEQEAEKNMLAGSDNRGPLDG